MGCPKLFGERVMSRDFDRQVAELQIRAVTLTASLPSEPPLTQSAGSAV